MGKRPSVSMKDVAALAQVSVGTISNVLNRPELVAPETRRRVEEAIDKLGWVRNESARQLRAGRSHAIGLIVMDIANPFFTDLARGVEEVATDAGYTVLLANSAQSADREAGHLQAMRQLRVGGLVVAPVGEALDTEPLTRLGIPVVLADRHGAANDACTVSVDDFTGGRLAAEHLLTRGHRRLAIAGGDPAVRQIRDRRDGFRRGMLLGCADCPEPLIFGTPTVDIAAGQAIAATLVDLPAAGRPTGVFAVNDLVAIGLLQGLVAGGLRVPDDVVLIGYDDIQFAAAATVPLSSIRQPRADLGRRAAQLLFEEIAAMETNSDHRHEHPRFQPELVARASTG